MLHAQGTFVYIVTIYVYTIIDKTKNLESTRTYCTYVNIYHERMRLNEIMVPLPL